MSSAVGIERAFTLSAFEALRLLRQYASDNPQLAILQLVDLIEKVDQDGRHLDLRAAAYLHEIVESECPLENPIFYQRCIRAVVLAHQPVWIRAMRQGRKRFVSSLKPDDVDVFVAAGLLLDPPPDAVVEWWDEIVGHARLAIDIQKMEQAREAERLSIAFEIARLEAIGIENRPEWVGLDDNFAGYDVASFEMDNGIVSSVMIEVKSTSARPLRFLLTRNEWNQAEKVGHAYRFHVWDMGKEPPVLHIRTVDQVRPLIPVDNHKGKWALVEIPLGGD
jgi:hypothetical protein